MLPALQYSALGLETFRDEVLWPATTPVRIPAEVAVWHPAGSGRKSGVSPTLAEARKATFQPVATGYRWGPVWSTAWFRVRAVLPSVPSGMRVALRFSSGTEATLWLDGRPFQGFDPYRDLAFAWPKPARGARVELFIEAACNLPLGISTFWWDHPELHARWKEEKPGRLEACELVVVDPALWDFVQRWDFLRKVLLAMPADSPRAMRINDAMRDIARSINRERPAEGMRQASTSLDAAIAGEGSSGTSCVAVGHAHIDTAWLWPVRETRRKCLRTFASVVRLIERFPQFHFICSQAQQYAWVEEDSPELFREITERVKQGRFEPTGAMWIEPDATCPSGESFIRQLMHGIGYWRERFGKRGEQRMLYLPDTFGFPPCLPQIATLAGIDTFITNKMSWCESNRFPHVTFRWRGLDGTEILTHLTPGHNYNSAIEPSDLLYGERNLVAQDGQSFVGRAIPEWLQPFGFGDGGGGPTAEQIMRATIAADCEGMPRVRQHSVDRFCDQLHAGRKKLCASGRDVPEWDGELYLELHRGTYTSQAWIKRQNRFAESLLRDVEALAASMPRATDRDRRGVNESLDKLWKLVLLNQFHDILPGSSIGMVYDDARSDHLAVAEAAGEARAQLVAAIGAEFATADTEAPVLVRNPASTARGGVVEVGDELFSVEAVPALGFEVVDRVARHPGEPTVRAERTGKVILLQNAWIEASIGPDGSIADLRSHGTERAANARDEEGKSLALNQLWLYDDQPRRWEAWDIDRDYAERGRRPGAPESIDVVTRHPLRAEVQVRRRIGKASELYQTYRLDAGSRRLEIRTSVDWREERTLLRALFPIDVRTRFASFGTQFGVLERPTHRNTSWDEARFEAPGHAWMDLSEPGFGVAVLDDGKYGRSVNGNMLGLSLLRSPNFPDAVADRGEHAFTYAVMVHDGDWREAGVDSEAEALREPLQAITLRPGRRGSLEGSYAPFRMESDQHVGIQVAAWKPAEDGKGRILRLVEMRGGRGEVRIRWTGPAAKVEAVDVLERPFGRAGVESALRPRLRHSARERTTTVSIRPFQIVTLRVIDAGRSA
ncbi:MAG: alpha-mannosidase [Phycisphaerae bacterium]|nr:alpha-mannosidase [Phycisphaerae bacterium]